MFVKRTDATGAWHVFHTSLGGTKTLFLNATNAAVTNIRYWDDTAPTSTVFTLGYDTDVNASGGTYVAYLFAHNAGGFGLTGTDNVISCGSYVTNASAKATINLGYEAQWVLVKKSSGADGWYLMDTMRGFAYSNTALGLQAQSSQAESAMSSGANGIYPTATGFEDNGTFATSSTFIYIAIRRGPMKVPTSGTSVYDVSTTANGTLSTFMNAPDAVLNYNLVATAGWQIADRLRGFLLGFPSNTSGAVTSNSYLRTNNTAAESTSNCRIGGLGVARSGGVVGSNVQFEPGVIGNGNFDTAYWFKRAPGFFDEVCYTGTGVARTLTHNLAAVPQLMIVKSRSDADGWWIWNNSFSSGYIINLDSNAVSGVYPDIFGNDTVAVIPTATVFSVGSNANVNRSGGTFVTYLFATVAGVSKVGSYTGTGTTLQINCGFTAGSRFVLIKRTDSTGDWYVWDSARGIVAGNDPYLLLNSTAAEVTGTDYVDTYSAGFEISSTAPAAINANGGTFIFLAIA
jgi:hypothetical protein